MSYQSKLAIQLEAERLSIISKLNQLSVNADIRNIVLIIAPLNASTEDFKIHVINSKTYAILGSLIITSGSFVHFKTCKELMRYKNIFVNASVKNPLKIFSISKFMDKMCSRLSDSNTKEEVTELFRSKQFYREEKSVDYDSDKLHDELKSVLYEENAMKAGKIKLYSPQKGLKLEEPRKNRTKKLKNVSDQNTSDDDYVTETSSRVPDTFASRLTSKQLAIGEEMKKSDKIAFQKEKINEKVEILYLSESFQKEDIISLLAGETIDKTKELKDLPVEIETKYDDGSNIKVILFFDDQSIKDNLIETGTQYTPSLMNINSCDFGEEKDGDKFSEVISKSIQCSPSIMSLNETYSKETLAKSTQCSNTTIFCGNNSDGIENSPSLTTVISKTSLNVSDKLQNTFNEQVKYENCSEVLSKNQLK